MRGAGERASERGRVVALESLRTSASVLRGATALGIALPGAASVALGSLALLGVRPTEQRTSRAMMLALAASFVSLVVASVGALAVDQPSQALGTWFELEHYAFHLSFQLDSTSVPIALLAAAITLVMARFSSPYLHREPGFQRFFGLLGVFASGMQVLLLAGSFELLFVGWELVGLTSVLLIAFFHERKAATRAALRAFVSYRVGDAGLLFAAALLHHELGTSELGAVREAAQGSGPVALGSGTVLVLGLALLLAAMGKASQLPFAWLPRAMEGPTPSSALFYGALSVHAGVYLLLRAEPLLERAPLLRACVVLVGLVGALYGTLSARVQADVKTVLALASMTQVAVMFVEVGLGLTTLARVHLAGHALVRSYQLLRAPSALAEAEKLALLPRHQTLFDRLLPAAVATRLYRHAIERFHVESAQERFVVGPVMALSRWLDELERGFVAALVSRRRAITPPDELAPPSTRELGGAPSSRERERS